MGSHEGNPPTSEELVRRAQAGDRQAFDHLMDRCRHRLESLVHLRLGAWLRPHVDVEDVLQETFLKAFQSLPRFQWQDKGSFFRWLAAIAEHVIQNLARRHSLKGKGGAWKRLSGGRDRVEHDGSTRWEDLPAPGAVSPSRAMRRNERFDRLERALSSLNGPRREVILLARVSGLPIKEIAARMGRSPDAVSVLLLRALRQLRELFGTTESFGLPSRSLLDSSRNGSGLEAGPLAGSENEGKAIDKGQ